MANKKFYGMNAYRERELNDFYATPEETTRALCRALPLDMCGSILEPACGEGHISKVLKEFCPKAEIVSTDIIQREDKFGMGVKGGIDFLTHDYGRKFDAVITNPPFSLSKQFVERALNLSNKYVIMLEKIQFLESKSRRELFDSNPPKRVYVFSERQQPLRNGNPLDADGKKLSNIMCLAWFVWEKCFFGKTTIEWI